MHVGLGHDLEQRSRKARIHFNELANGWPTEVGGAADEYELQEPPDDQLADVSEAREKDNTGERRRGKNTEPGEGLDKAMLSEDENQRRKAKSVAMAMENGRKAGKIRSCVKEPVAALRTRREENETQTSTQKMIISKILERPVNCGGSDVGAMCGEMRLGSCCSCVSPRMKNCFTPIRSKKVFTVRPKVILR